MYHCPSEEPRTVPASFDTRDVAERTRALGCPRELRLTIEGLEPGTRFSVETVGMDHGDVVGDWQSFGSPRNLSKEQKRSLLATSAALGTHIVSADNAGVLTLATTLQPWDIVAIRQSES
jgi:xylan 1,4-beta-xylosidase